MRGVGGGGEGDEGGEERSEGGRWGEERREVRGWGDERGWCVWGIRGEGVCGVCDGVMV